MADRIPIIRRGDMLLPANQEALETIRALPIGREMACDVLQLRNEGLHRKAFAFVKLAFDYWNPKNFLQSAETQTVKRLHEFMVSNGIDRETSKTLCNEFLSNLNQSRKGMNAQKNIESFREEITIAAGYYTIEIGPSGPRKRAKSWAYKNMTQADFEKLFAAIRETCWQMILSQTFETIEQADAVAEQMARFD